MDHHIPLHHGDTIWALLDDKIDLSLSLRGSAIILTAFNADGVAVETYCVNRHAIQKSVDQKAA